MNNTTIYGFNGSTYAHGLYGLCREGSQLPTRRI